MNRLSACALTATAALVLAACGGGDSTVSTTIEGAAIKGPVNGGTVTVKTADGKACGTTTTKPDGTYSLSTECTGDLVIEVSGGTYTDEATSKPVTLNQLKTIVAANGGTTKAVVTPLTYLGYITAVNNSALNSAGHTKAMQALATQFKLSADELAATPNITDAAANAYGKVLRAFSQAVADKGGTFSLETLMGEMGDKAKFAGTSSAFAAAFNTINKPTSPVTFSFDGNALTINTSGTGTGTGTGTNSLTIITNVSGIAAPAVTVNNIPKPSSQSEFCGALQNDATFKGLAQGGAALTIKSCSFSGNVGNISAEVSITTPIAMTIPYTIVYTYK